MYAIAFDLVVADTEQHHPKGVSQAYSEIGATLAEFGFRRVQGSLYVTDDENMANLFLAMQALKGQAWFPKSVRAAIRENPRFMDQFAGQTAGALNEVAETAHAVD